MDIAARLRKQLASLRAAGLSETYAAVADIANELDHMHLVLKTISAEADEPTDEQIALVANRIGALTPQGIFCGDTVAITSDASAHANQVGTVIARTMDDYRVSYFTVRFKNHGVINIDPRQTLAVKAQVLR